MIAYGEVKGFELLRLENYLAKSIIILISGKKRVGKTLVANILADILIDHGYSVEVKSFSNEIKNCAYSFFNWDGKKDEKGRKLLQSIGDTGREYNEDLWVNALINNIEDGLFLSDIYIIDDWRFPNEREFIENLNSFYNFTIRVESTNRGDYKDDDITENSLPVFDLESDGGSCPKNYYDFVVDNSYSEEELRNSLMIILNAIEKMEVNNG